ncbi:MAG: oligosaccharide flippase family protein [Candidatus Hydrogenedentes bacterium]|nr:oligosaccharide flippase family protein [Candidatus Hydrogenedentota bacterium]
MTGAARTLSNAAIYGIGIVINRGVTLALIALYTRTLTMGEYADFELATTTIIFMTVLLDLGLNPALVRFCHMHEDMDLKDLFGTTVTFLTAWCAVLCGLAFAFQEQMSMLVFGAGDKAMLFALVAVDAAFTVLSNLPLAWLRARERSLQFMAINLVRAVVGPCAIAIFLFWMKWGLTGVILGDICGLASLTLVGVFANARWYRPVVRWAMLRPMLRFGLPLIPMGIGGALLTVSDRYFLNAWVTKEELAVYGVAAKIGLMVVIVSQAIQTAYPPYAYRLANEPEAPERFADILRMLLAGMAAITVVITAASNEILWVLAPQENYGGATAYVHWLALSFACDGAALMVMTSLSIVHRTVLASVIVGAAGIAKIVLSVLLIRTRGGIGAAEATVLAYAVELALTFWFTQRCYPVPHAWGKLACLLGITIAALYAASVALTWSIAPSLIARVALVVAFAAVCAVTVFRPSERSEALRRIRRRLVGG